MEKVLIVDDSIISRRMIKKLISGYNFEIEEAENGTQALEKIRSSNFAIIFLDLLMPDINGIEILEKLKQDNISAKIVVISADIQETTKAKCKELGAFAFINKPPKEDELNFVLKEQIKQ